MDIAKDVSRSERFVTRWWKHQPLAVPRPPGIHQYLANTMAGGKQADRTNMWRGVEIVRGFYKDTAGLYDEILTRFSAWKQSASETKDFRTASYFLRYDREGKMKMMTMKSASYQRSVVSRLDDLVRKMHQKVNITDPQHGASMYLFSDGDASVGSHRHVFWSARVALGAERIMMVDKTPILMQEGDLIIIGPQRHGVPSMPEIMEGSLRISVPFQPAKRNSKHVDTSPLLGDDECLEDDEVEDESTAWGPGDDGNWGEDTLDADQDLVEDPTQVLMDMGFDAAAAGAALRLCGDLGQAIEALTGGGLPHMLSISSGADQDSPAEVDEDSDLALARKLQMDELHQESREQLQQQFEEYDKLINIDEAEKAWDGYGDLMHNSFRRASLNLDMLGPQTVYSLGVAAHGEKHFFELLSLHSIRVVYDFRPTDYRDEVRCQQPHFELRVLKSNCRQRGIHYRHVAVGRETAWGTLRHLESEEVQHILVELVWRAKHHGRTVFLGQEEDWRADGRLAIAEEVAKHGHTVQHVRSEGSLERHTIGMEVPDFLLQEEAQLRKIDAQRRAGELHRPDKSAVNRSLESVARSLATEKTRIDVSAELRDAESQTDLVRAQKRMVRLQMHESRKETGLSKKELVAVPAHIAREASAVWERTQAKKENKVKSTAGSSSVSQAPQSSASSSHPAQTATEAASLAGASAKDKDEAQVDLVEEQVQPDTRRRWGHALPVQTETVCDSQSSTETSRKKRWDRRAAK